MPAPPVLKSIASLICINSGWGKEGKLGIVERGKTKKQKRSNISPELISCHILANVHLTALVSSWGLLVRRRQISY